jgi:hypothetical protein
MTEKWHSQWVLTCIALAADAAVAEPRRFDDWAVDKGTWYQEAYTRNTSDEVLGVFCLLETQQCLAYFVGQNRCTVGNMIPVLVNADTGAALHKTSCQLLEGGGEILYINVFEDFAIVGTFMAARSLGIAVPLESGKFRALRFSLIGSNEAIQSARRLPDGVRSRARDGGVF